MYRYVLALGPPTQHPEQAARSFLAAARAGPEEGLPPLTCAANAVVSEDPAGNRKLDKAKATGRIDGMVALAQAIGVAVSKEEDSDISPFLSDPLVL